MIRKVVEEVVGSIISEKLGLMGDGIPNAVETIDGCVRQLEDLRDGMVKSGLSKHEITVERITNVAGELRKIMASMQCKHGNAVEQ